MWNIDVLNVSSNVVVFTLCQNVILGMTIYFMLKCIFLYKGVARSRYFSFLFLTGVASIIPQLFQNCIEIGLIVKAIVIAFLGIIILKARIVPSVISTLIVQYIFIANRDIFGVSSVAKKLSGILTYGIIGKLSICVVVVLIAILMHILYTKTDNLIERCMLKTNAKYLKYIYVILTAITIIIGMLYYEVGNGFTCNRFGNKGIIITNLMIVVMYSIFIGSIFIVNMFDEYKKWREELEYQRFYNQTLKYLLGDLRRFKHDYKNMLAVIGGYLHSNSYDELKIYHQGIVDNLQTNNRANNKSVLKIKNAGLLGLVFYKLNLADEKEVIFSVDVRTDVQQINMKINEFCEILGILLDNAMECAEKTDSKRVSLKIVEQDDCKIFEIKNSVQERVNIEEIYTKGFSTKGKHRGIGLHILNKVVRKTKNLQIETKCSDTEFVQILYLYK